VDFSNVFNRLILPFHVHLDPVFGDKPMRCLLSIILLLIFLTACRESARPDPINTAPAVTHTEQVTITLAVEGSSLNRYRPLIDVFEEENPHIRVRLVNTGEVAYRNESGIRALATSFDVFPYTPNRQGETQDLLDLRPFLDLDPHFDHDDFLPGLLPAAPEPLLAVPTGAAYYLTSFDKNAFAAAGLSHPDLDWTIDDFLAAALALTTREGGEVTRWGYVPAQLRYSPLLATQLTGPLQTGDGLRLSDPDVVTAVQWLSDLFTVHQVSPWLEEYKPADRRASSGQSALALINGGMAAMWHTTHLLYDANDENVGVTAVPRGLHGYAADPILYGFAMSRGTRQPEAAWQLLHFLSRQPPQEIIWSLLSPARRSVAVATGYWEGIPADLSHVLHYAAENNVAPRIPYQASTVLPEVLTSHIDDKVPVASALGQRSAGVTPPTEPPPTEAIAVQETEPEAQDNVIEIVFTTYSYLFERHQLLANQFRREYPTIAVRVESPDYTPGMTRFERVAGSDCFVESALIIHNSELRAAILPPGPLLELDGNLQAEDFYPLQLHYFVEEGELLAIPAYMRAHLLNYNKRLFEEAGLPEPPLDWTFNDFLEVAQQLTHGQGDLNQYGYAEYFEYLINFGWAGFGVEVVEHAAGIPTYDYEATAEMVAWYADLIRLHGVQPSLTGNSVVDFAQFETLLLAERVAMWPSLGSDIVTLRNNAPLPFAIGTAPVPLGPSGSRGDLIDTVYGYYIMAGSPHREACWQWIKLLSLHPQSLSGSMNHSVPALIRTAQSAEYMAHAGEQIAAATRAYMESSNPGPRGDPVPWFFPGNDWLRAAYRKIANGEADVATALSEADAKFSQYRQCIIERGAFNDFIEQRDCAVSVDGALRGRYFGPGG
jgi:ABC-type glycerol-3-phosphate transport system substrate-binding protein